MYKNFFKRLLDFFLSLIALICLSPLLIIVSACLHFANKGAGVFFFQERPGKNEKIFKVIKFKTMTDEKDANGKLLPDGKRLTKAGRFIRSTSIDELPQFINVLKGDMALIGPRPLYVRYLPYYNNVEKRRHEIRPGITGLAQVNGRTSISWNEKLKYDVEYVDKCSFLFDIKIFLRTIYNVLRRADVGVEYSGTNDFNDFRIKEWLKDGKLDKIAIAEEETKKLINHVF